MVTFVLIVVVVVVGAVVIIVVVWYMVAVAVAVQVDVSVAVPLAVVSVFELSFPLPVCCFGSDSAVTRRYTNATHLGRAQCPSMEVQSLDVLSNIQRSEDGHGPPVPLPLK